MAKINLAEVLGKRYKKELGVDSSRRVGLVLGYIGLEEVQSKTGLAGDVLIEGREVVDGLINIVESQEFDRFVLALEAARLSGADEFPRVVALINKFELAVKAITRPDIVGIIEGNLREMGPERTRRDFAIPYFDDLD